MCKYSGVLVEKHKKKEIRETGRREKKGEYTRGRQEKGTICMYACQKE
jgi:hypothetical protein